VVGVVVIGGDNSLKGCDPLLLVTKPNEHEIEGPAYRRDMGYHGGWGGGGGLSSLVETLASSKDNKVGICETEVAWAPFYLTYISSNQSAVDAL